MSDDSYSFSTARARLDEIVAQVRKKDTSLEKSLDLLEEGVRLANACTELIDHADWTVGGVDGAAAETDGGGSEEVAEDGEAAVSPRDGAGDVIGEDASSEADAHADATDAEFAADDDAFGDAADEAWSDDTPEYRDDEA